MGTTSFASSLIENVILPPNLVEISGWSFTICTNLCNITIPKFVSKISEAAFVDCLKLSLFISESPNFVVFNGVLYDQYFTTLYGAPCNYNFTDLVPTVKYISDARGFSSCSFEEFILKNKIEKAGSFLFRSCYNLKRVDLSCGIFKRIEYTAFSWCYNLVELKLPNTVETFSYVLFSGTRKLTSLTLPTNLKTIHARAFENSFITDIKYCGFYDVPYVLPAGMNVHVTHLYSGGQTFAGISISDNNFICENDFCPNSFLLLPIIKTNQCNYQFYTFPFSLYFISLIQITIT
ncbi:hypothetical protein TVAG_009650 [Trichomonas vaginalis G3]|uniref:Surface antigen BspA-like n=1 Tax=Trichomonas vaginalis (strain ATCC PRA-98 / G3) TaxID=412133 RepID=A2ET42_TRIV3|nr:ribonuclease inhibitor domain-containing protein [Trichomonas vaginalis G3]EAY04158.1 hypothetical protein TVAG_009650 [Trichomonas vaginalis G3]KAI5514880.1 ribonuclease inhibitor domain-containing protein [Trichomonas vaginalis G3]|eukprot:XP_001316381.1 hypothetical protein [Trichomonas vaginalis G3]